MANKEMNIFEGYAGRKNRLRDIVDTAWQTGWITDEKRTEITNRIDEETLVIGVIGQMKSGKSTFLNSFLFGKEVLPAATTPMTAALSVITHGEQDQIVASFYTREEWEEQKSNAKRSLEDVQGDPLEKSKIEVAKDLVDRSKVLGNELDKLLNTKKTDSLDNLIEYVGADGKYVSITKSVEIHTNNELLKGVEIVDTPGFNDPIVSREQRTKEFLQKADVVILMLYAGRPFDATDRDILFKNVQECGMGKVVIAINKYDMPYETGETQEEIVAYVKKEISKAADEYGSDELNELLKDITPIPISAQMALLSMLPMEEINKSEALSHAYNRQCSTFEVSSQAGLREKSQIDELFKEIQSIIFNEKEEILLRKPLNTILSIGDIRLADIKKEIVKLNQELKLLNTPADEIVQKEREYKRISKNLKRRVKRIGDDLSVAVDDIKRNWLRKGKTEVHKAKMEWCNADKVGKTNIFQPKKRTRLFKGTVERTLLNHIQPLYDEPRGMLTAQYTAKLKELENDSIDLFLRYNDDFNDEDIKLLISSIKLRVVSMLDEMDFREPYETSKLTIDLRLELYPGDVAYRRATYNDVAEEVAEVIETDMERSALIFSKINEEVTDLIYKGVFEDFMAPLMDEIAKINEGNIVKEKQIEEVTRLLEAKAIEKEQHEEQIETITTIAEQIKQRENMA